MGRKITYRATVRIVVDEDTWADEYGMAVSEVTGDVPTHLTDYVKDKLSHHGLSYMFESVRLTATRIKVEG